MRKHNSSKEKHALVKRARNSIVELWENGGSDGTRTRGLRRDRPTL
jgi:hypothetical protein